MWWCGFYGTYWRAWPRRTARRKTSSVLLVRRCRRPKFDVWIGLATRGAFSIIELSFEQKFRKVWWNHCFDSLFRGFQPVLEVCSRGSSILDWNRLDRCIWSSVFRLSFQKSDMFAGRLNYTDYTVYKWSRESDLARPTKSEMGEAGMLGDFRKLKLARSWILLCLSCDVFGHLLPIQTYTSNIAPYKSSSDLFNLYYCFFGDFCSQGSVKRFNMSKSSAFTPRWKQTFPEVVCFQCQVEVDLRWTLFLTLLSCKHLIGHRPKYKCMTYYDIYIYISYIYIRCTDYLLISCLSDPGSFKPSSSVLTHSWCRSQGRSKEIYRK